MLLNFTSLVPRPTLKKQTGYRQHKDFQTDLLQTSNKGKKFSQTKQKDNTKFGVFFVIW